MENGCAYLSDLHWLSGGQKMRLAREIERIEAPEASLHEWNDALEYLLGCGAGTHGGSRAGRADRRAAGAG